MISTHENLGGKQDNLNRLEMLCESFDTEAATLELMIADLEADLDAVKKKHLKNLKQQAGEVADAQAMIHNLIERAPELFEKPRTMTLHGVKVGLTTSKGSLEFDDEETVIKLVKKHHKDDVATLIRTKETVNKDALRLLNASELAKLGCSIEGAGDSVVLKRTAGDVEKLINKLITKLVDGMVESEVAA